MEARKEYEVLQTVISKAWEDADFRKRLLANPISEIENLTGARIVLPEGKELIFIDQTDRSKIFVNIPAEPDLEDVELTEEQLEVIAGGGQSVMKEIAQSLFPSQLINYIKN